MAHVEESIESKLQHTELQEDFLMEEISKNYLK